MPYYYTWSNNAGYRTYTDNGHTALENNSIVAYMLYSLGFFNFLLRLDRSDEKSFKKYPALKKLL